MAIKKRSKADEQERAKRIEEFGAGADAPTPTTVAPKKPPMPSKLLLRFDSDELHRMLAEVAELEGRSKNAMALRALALGLEKIKATYD